LGREVERLAHEHGELQAIMDRIHEELDALKPEDHLLIRDCCTRIQSLLSYIEHHENAENLLVLSAFTDDLGDTE
jgi:hemerythrin-like domain-containing protein